MIFSKPYADFVARLRVPSGFLLVGAFLYFAAPTRDSLWAGLPLAVLGLALRAWAAGHLEKNQKLIDGGPYAWVRNPLYLGTLAVAAGLVIATRRWELGLLFAAVFALVYLPVITNEEGHLRNLFPAYRDYCDRVPALIPRRPRKPGGSRFSWRIYWRNEEYNALLGFLAGYAFLAWQAWF